MNNSYLQNLSITSSLKNNNTPSFKEKHHHSDKKINTPVFIGSTVGTLVPLVYMIKKQGLKLPSGFKLQTSLEKLKSLYKTYNKIEFESKELIALSLGALSGGSISAAVFDKEKSLQNNKNRIKEFIFQSLNVALPTLFTGALIKGVDKNISKFKTPLKILAPLIGVGVGMPVANIVSNKINKTFIDKNDKGRKIHPKNYLVHSDDAISALALIKVPFVDKLPIKAMLPLIFTNCGYEAGTSKH